jgi:hypothetical protein
MKREQVIRVLDDLVEQRWKSMFHLKKRIGAVQDCARSNDAFLSLACAAASYVLAEVLDYAGYIEEELERGFGAAASIAEIERLQDYLKPAISDLRVAVQDGRWEALAEAQRRFIDHWDSFEKENISQVISRGTQQCVLPALVWLDGSGKPIA